MADALKALAGTGAIGAILAVAFALLAGTIGVLGWALRRLVDSAIKQQDRFVDFMDAYCDLEMDPRHPTHETTPQPVTQQE